MKKLRSLPILLALALCSILTLSCEENEPVITGIEPYFRMVFINQDSIEQLNDSIAVINFELTAIADSLDILDSLSIDNDSIDYNANEESLNELKKDLTKYKTSLNSVINRINSGKIKLSFLKGDGGNDPLTYEDSLTSYKIPLNTHADFSRYTIGIGDQQYLLDTYYDRELVEVEQDVIIIVRPFLVDTINTNFDSLKISYSDSTDFNSNETTVKAYF